MSKFVKIKKEFQMKKLNRTMMTSEMRNAKVFLPILLILTVFFSIPPCFAQEEDKQIRLRGGQDFEFSIAPEKESYSVNESIRFKVKGNQDFFLYLFSVNQDQNTAVLLIPGSKQKGNKYKKGKTFTVPNHPLEFVSDTPGTEKIIAFASTKYIHMDTRKYRRTGEFMITDLTQFKSQEKAFKMLVIKKKKKKDESQYTLKELSININSPHFPIDLDSTEKTTVFINTSKASYRTGEVVSFGFGADQNGFISLYSVSPGDKVSFLKSLPVEENRLYALKARAISPAGNHALVAVFSDERPGWHRHKNVADLAGVSFIQSKDVALIPDDRSPSATVKFFVK